MSPDKYPTRLSQWKTMISSYLPGFGIILFILTITILLTLSGGITSVAAAPMALLLRKRSPISEQPIAVENIINTVMIYNQGMPSATLLTNNNLLISWTSVGQDSDREGIFANLLDIKGKALLNQEFQMNAEAYDAQLGSWVTKIGNTSVSAWSSSMTLGISNNMILRRFDNSGNPLTGEIIANSITAFPRIRARLAALPNQAVFSAWTSYNQITSGQQNSYGQIFNADLSQGSGEFRIDNADNAYLNSLASLDNTVMATWQTFVYNATAGKSLGNIFAQRFTATSQKIGNTFMVNTDTGFSQMESFIAALPTGYVVAWQSVNQVNANSNTDIYAQWFDSFDNKIGSQLLVNTYTVNAQQNAAIAVLSDGSVMIAWHSNGQDGSDWGIYAQWFTANRTRLGREFQIHSYINNAQDSVVMTVLPDSNIAFVWESSGQDGSGYSIIHKVLTPRLDPFIYNTPILLTLKQNTPQNGTHLVLNPMVDADTITVTLTPSAGIILSTANTTSYNYGNATVIHDMDTDEISISGHAVPVNLALNQLIITPTNYFSGNTAITIHATDGSLHADFNATVAVEITPVAYMPDLTTTNEMVIYQNTPFVLTPTLFNASNPDPNVHRPIAYNIGSALHITFFNTTNNSAAQIINFTNDELMNSLIEARPDDSGLTPSFTLQAIDSDTGLTSDITPMTVMFIARPELALSSFRIDSNQVFTFTTDNLKANGDISSANSVWQFAAIQHAQIINPQTNAQWPMDENGAVTVSQEDVVHGLVGIKPNGKSTSPSFTVAFGIMTNVAGQYLYSRASAAQVNFNYVANNAKLAIGLGASLGGFAALSAAGACIFFCMKEKNKQRALLDKQATDRQQEPLANAVWEKLGFPATYADFTSEAGLEFVDAINEVLQKMDQQVSYKDHYLYFAEKFIGAMQEYDITADYISDHAQRISTYINQHWNEAEAIQVQATTNITASYNSKYETPLSPI